jgi:ADP-ribose pyrophosphatase YjhB (NUDIX family)
MSEPEYCPQCGGELGEKLEDGRQRKYCASCDQIIYQNPKPVAAVAVVKDDELLMIKRGINPGKGKWSLPAGFLERDEAPEDAAVRELEEETGLKADAEDLEVLGVAFEERLPDQYVVASVYRIKASKTEGEPTGADDAQEARFWNLEELEKSDEVRRAAFEEEIDKAL